MREVDRKRSGCEKVRCERHTRSQFPGGSIEDLPKRVVVREGVERVHHSGVHILAPQIVASITGALGAASGEASAATERRVAALEERTRERAFGVPRRGGSVRR